MGALTEKLCARDTQESATHRSGSFRESGLRSVAAIRELHHRSHTMSVPRSPVLSPHCLLKQKRNRQGDFSFILRLWAPCHILRHLCRRCTVLDGGVCCACPTWRRLTARHWGRCSKLPGGDFRSEISLDERARLVGPLCST